MKIKMISSEDKEEWLKETYDYLQKLKEDKYGDVRLDYIMLYELHKEEHKEIERLNNIIFEAIDKAKTMKASMLLDAVDGIDIDSQFVNDLFELIDFLEKELKEGK